MNATAGEDCDGAGRSEACNDDCTNSSCGDGIVNATAGEDCDDEGESETCNVNCTASECGDGVSNTNAGEECDDAGESLSCDDDCTTAECGDGNANAAAGEECDDTGESAICNGDCTAAECGDGIVNETAGEQCDDGGTEDGDDCSATCQLEGSCFENSQWQPVDCSTDTWVWSSDRTLAPSLSEANDNQVLWAGCTHAAAANTCSLDGTGWVSTETVVMSGCGDDWLHITDDSTFNCGGHDGDVVRRLALGNNDCYDY